MGALKQQQKINHSNLKRKRTKAYKDALCRKRRALYRLYEKTQEEINYHKNMMLVPIDNKKCHRDHTYTRADGPKAKMAKCEYNMQYDQSDLN